MPRRPRCNRFVLRLGLLGAGWVGWASKRLSPADDGEEVLQQAIAKILAPFPARPGVEPAGSD